MQYEKAQEVLKDYQSDMDRLIARLSEELPDTEIIVAVKEALNLSDKLAHNMKMLLEIHYVPN